jgi:Dolichyl-phosphate-mannose-protein mannosyltransferase
VRAEVRERFLTLPRCVALALVVLVALSFDGSTVHDDGVVYFSFLRRIFGADTPTVAYQFGSTFWNAPFYLASQLVATRGQFNHYHSGEIAVAVASNVAMLLCLYVGWLILRDLSLPRGAAVLLLSLFGTPLFFYGIFSPSYKHAADTLYVTAACWFLLRSTRENARRHEFVGAGVFLGLAVCTRYANASILLAFVCVFAASRLRRAATWILSVSVAATALLLLVPVIRGIPYGQPADIYAVGATSVIDPVLRNSQFSATAPFKMLFTLHRGLFLWTPLTLIAVIGFCLLLRRDRANRAYLAALGIAALALVAAHSLWGRQWDGGGSFSQRFLTALFPFFLVGTAGLLQHVPRLGLAVAIPCTLFSLWLGLVLYTGYYNASQRDSLVQIVHNFRSFTGPPTTKFHKPPPYDSLQNMGRKLDDAIGDRWRLYWRLVS